MLGGYYYIVIFCVVATYASADDRYLCKPDPPSQRTDCDGAYPGIVPDDCRAIDCCYDDGATPGYLTCFNKTRVYSDIEIADKLESLDRGISELRNTTDGLRTTHEKDTSELRQKNDELCNKISEQRDELNTLRDRHEQDVEQLRARTEMLNTTVAFTAAMDGKTFGPRMIPYGNHGVSTNLGGAFDPSTHTFTAPYAGLYLFSWSYDNHCGLGKHGRSYIYQNGVRLNIGAYQVLGSSSSDQSMATQVALIQLAARDSVDIRLSRENSYAYGGSAYEAQFSGLLVRRTN